MAGRGCGQVRADDTDFFQRSNGTLENARGLAPELARDRIVDQDRLLIFGDSINITSTRESSPRKSKPCARNCSITSICTTCSTRRKSPTPNTTR